MCYSLIRWYSNRKGFLVTLFIALSMLCQAQLLQPDRFEVLINKEGFDVVPADHDGLFLIGDMVEPGSNEVTKQLFKLDTAFRAVWQRSFNVPVGQELVDQQYDNGKLYFLFRRNELKNRNLELIVFDQADGSAVSHIIRNFIPLTYFDFRVANNSAIIAGYYNYRPLVILYNFTEGIPMVLPGLFADRSELIQLKLNRDNTFDVLLQGRNIQKQPTIFINSYNYAGVLTNSTILEPIEKNGLLFGRAANVDGGDKIVAGVYGRFDNEYSRGLFVARVDDNQQQDLKYYNYADLKNFFSYMRANRERRVRDRIERRKIKQKKLKFNYRLLVHDLIKEGDQYIMLGEAFYPKYRTVTGSHYGSGIPVFTFNAGMVQKNRIFEGYRYTHAVVMGFNEKGDLLWDNSFEINDVISFELEQFVHASYNQDKLALLYVFNDKIRSKIIKENEVLEGKDLTPIALKFDGDFANEGETKIDGLANWYDNVFITFGTQKIKNNVGGVIPKERNVFFINKVIYK